MLWVTRGFWACAIIYLVGAGVLTVRALLPRGLPRELLTVFHLVELIGRLCIILALVMMGHWLWAKRDTMDWVGRAFLASCIIFFVGIFVLGFLRAILPLGLHHKLFSISLIHELVAGLGIILGLVMLGRWLWAKLFT